MNSNFSFTALVVVYNKNCGDSATCNSLINAENINVIVYDNSSKDLENRQFCKEQGWTYLGGQGNMGLSKAYNSTVDYLVENGYSGYICLFDDDTKLSDNFIEEIRQGVLQYSDGKIFVPILTQGKKIVSPTKENGASFNSIEECLKNSPKRIQAFNSCMTVSLDIFKGYRYDERIFLDGVDHLFMRDMLSMGNLPYILPVVCEHGFSGNQKGTKSGAVVRYRIIVKDYKVLYENSKLKYMFVVGKRALHLCLQHKSLVFLKIFLLGK